MKKFLTVVFSIAILISCVQNNYKKMAKDMEKIIMEEKEVLKKITPVYSGLANIEAGKNAEKIKSEYISELKAISIENIRKQNEVFKKKYEKINLKAKTMQEQACKSAQIEYPKYVDSFLKMYAEYKTGAISGEKLFSWPIINLRRNLNSQEGFFKFCESAGNKVE